MPTIDQREIVVRMLADGATRAQMTAALGLGPRSSAFPRAFRAEIVAARPAPVPCVICGRFIRRPTQVGQLPPQTCSDAHDRERARIIQRTINGPRYREENREEINRRSRLSPKSARQKERDRIRSIARYRKVAAIVEGFRDAGILPRRQEQRTTEERAASREYYLNNRDRIISAAKRRYLSNRDSVIDRAKRDYRRRMAVVAVFLEIKAEEENANGNTRG